MRRSLFLTFFIAILSVSSAQADFYRWVDRDGKEFFTNEPQKIPAEYRTSAEKVNTDNSRVSVEEKSVRRPAKVSQGKEHKDRYGRGEGYWRKKATALRSKLHDQEDERTAVAKQLKGQDENATGSLSSKKKKRANLEKRLAKLEKDIAKTRRKLDVDLPEEARKADAYPGWIRE